MQIKNCMNKATDDITPKIIGITGGIGCGKTVATDALKAAGYCVIDADEISRELFARGADGERMLCDAFPQARSDGTLDRARLRALIAADPTARKKLNDITHPAIINEIQSRIRTVAASTVILSAPLLFESGLDELCDKIICVACPFELQIERVMRRDGIDERAARTIIAAQMQDKERRDKSDVIISSDLPLDEYTKRVLQSVKQTEKSI